MTAKTRRKAHTRTAIGTRRTVKDLARILFVQLLPACAAVGLSLGVAAAADQDFVERMVKRVNEIRREHNVAPVRENPKLSRVAQVHAEDMARHEFFGHRGSDGSRLEDRLKRVGFDYKVVAENLAGGLASPELTVDSWMESSEHRRNMVDVQLCRVGVGYVHVPGDAGKVAYEHYWTLVLARPTGPFCPLD